MNIKSTIESILLVAEKPVKMKEIADVLGIKLEEVQKNLTTLTEEYKNRGIRVIRKGESVSLGTAPENSEAVARFLNEELRNELSKAALEVLAIIVYKQPVTRIEVENLRGSSSDYLIRNLLIRGLVREVGRKEVVGKPILYGTTIEFLQHLGLEDEKELPKIEELITGEPQVDTITEAV